MLYFFMTYFKAEQQADVSEGRRTSLLSTNVMESLESKISSQRARRARLSSMPAAPPPTTTTLIPSDNSPVLR